MRTIQIIKSAFQKVENKRYHYLHKKEANSILTQIGLTRDKLSAHNRKMADEYAVDVFGSTRYAPWLYVYTLWAGGFKEGWIPDNYYGEIVVPKLQGDYGKISFNNMFTNAVFGTDKFPDLAYYVNRKWLSKNRQIMSPDLLEEFLFKNHDEIFFKLDNSLKGRGIYAFNKANFSLDKIKSLGNGVFQSRVRHHNFFENFSSEALATLRVTTVIDKNNNVSARSAYAKLGRLGETYINAKAQVIVPIELRTGVFENHGHLQNWSVLTSHPDSDVSFERKKIPKFNEIVELCINLHSKIPYVGCIGWDIAIDQNEELHILEWNGFHNDIKYAEMTQGPCFADLGWENLWKERD